MSAESFIGSRAGSPWQGHEVKDVGATQFLFALCDQISDPMSVRIIIRGLGITFVIAEIAADLPQHAFLPALGNPHLPCEPLRRKRILA